MKNYPYIYSLSTVGLIHHYNNDYLFNRVRTDFTGDSGTGKSMIADLLQLIFVGSAEFEAATESIDEKRRPKGMVLTDTKRGLSGKGYAFLNIAIDLQQYLVMGMYLEQSTNLARPFLVYQGYDIENPDFLRNPLLHEDFLDEKSILSLEDLKKKLSIKQYNCEVMGLSSYHRHLYRQQILPFDLADNPAKLKAYALIIQSFSRGKGFKFDTKNLQDFLFGTSTEKNIMAIYQQQIENINSTLLDSLNYQKQIAELTKKRNALQELIKLDSQKEDALKVFLASKYNFIEQRIANYSSLLENSFPLLVDSAANTVAFKIMDIQEQRQRNLRSIETIKAFEKEKNGETSLEKWAEDAMKLLLNKKNEKLKVDQITAIMANFDGSIENVTAYYKLQAANNIEKATLESFVRKLSEKQILNIFEDSDWNGNYGKSLKNYQLDIEDIESGIKTNTALLKFSSVDDPYSIAHWAISSNKALTHEQESLLVKYKELIIAEPENKHDYYLPEPQSLFENLEIEDKYRDQNGFWISIVGIYEYVLLTEERFLNSDSPEVKKKYFLEKHNQSALQLQSLKEQKKMLQDFYAALHSISALEENIALYVRKNEIAEFTEILPLSVDRPTFDALMESYKNKDSIKQSFKSAEQGWNTANDKLQAFKKSYAALSKINDIANHLVSLQTKQKKLESSHRWLLRKHQRITALSREDNTAKATVLMNERLQQYSLAEVLSESTASETALKEKCKEYRKQLKSLALMRSTLKIELEDHFMDINQLHRDDPYTESEIEKMHDDAEHAAGAYSFAIESLITTFLFDDRYKYTNEQDWRKIARGLLPEVFKSEDINEDQFSSEIEERLQNIIDKNKVIGDRKVQMLLEVFGKVEAAFTAFSTEIDRLKVFFNGNDKRITGGHKVVIKADPSSDYPILWITEFKRRIREESTNRTGLFKIADDAIDFKEIIQRSFRQCGGKKSDPKIEDLLNPKKYFELSFSLQKDNVKSSGSTGQVYTAIALLCIARISLIEQEQGTKKRKGVRFMPVDEAEGLGSNYEMLSNIAKSEDYQIISMSINPVGEFEKGSHYIYMLNEPEDEEIRINGVPFAQFTEKGILSNIKDFTAN